MSTGGVLRVRVGEERDGVEERKGARGEKEYEERGRKRGEGVREERA